jgi:hypothetical protein
MTSWMELDLAGISTEMATVPEGQYVMTLLPGAKYNQWSPNKLEVGAKIAEGEYANRVVYFSYGDPEKVPTMAGAFKRLEIALAKNSGVAIETGDDPVAYLNSVAGAKFIGTVRHRTFVKQGETEPTLAVDLNVFKVKAVPEAA